GARLCFHGGVNRNVREFYNLHEELIPTLEPSAVDRESVRRLVLVEVSDRGRLGEFADLAERSDVEVVVFDHHGKSPFAGATAFARAESYIEDVSALVSRIGEVADWDVLVLSVAMEGRALVVGRSRTSTVAIDRTLKTLDKNRHAQAASAIVHESDPKAILKR